MLMPVKAFGVRAVPYPVEYIQPDGSKVEIMIKGDERNHSAYTLDGYLLMHDADGFLAYATVGENGFPVVSGYKATAINNRSAIQRKFLSGLDKSALETATQQSATKRKALGDTPKYIFPGSAFPATGSPRALVILVEYQDVKFSMSDPHDFYSRQINGENFTEYGAIGSARNYFIYNSMGIFQPQFDVYGPVTLKHGMAYYGTNDRYGDDQHAEEMITEGCEQLSKRYDLSVYDNDGDGFIDNVFAIYAGYGEADSYKAETVWPHSVDLTDLGITPPEFCGVKVNRYGCTCELDYSANRPDGIGTFVHEFSHVLGLPDLYHTTMSRDGTPGYWSVLDSGPYNNNGVTPPNYSAHERYALNWLEPEKFQTSGDYTLEAIDKSNRCFYIPTEKEDEFYLLENRQANGGDAFIPGHGMLIWHVDYDPVKWLNNTVNNLISHQCVDLVEADGLQGNKTNKADSWPGTSNKTAFGFFTTPSLRSWAGNNLDTEITDIAENNGVISFHVEMPEKSGLTLPTEPSGVYIADGFIYSRSVDSSAVYDITGRLTGYVSALSPLPLPGSGIYIVTTKGKRIKILNP